MCVNSTHVQRESRDARARLVFDSRQISLPPPPPFPPLRWPAPTLGRARETGGSVRVSERRVPPHTDSAHISLSLSLSLSLPSWSKATYAYTL